MWGAAGRNRGKGNCSWNVTYKRRINFLKRQKEETTYEKQKCIYKQQYKRLIYKFITSLLNSKITNNLISNGLKDQIELNSGKSFICI